MIHRAFRLPVPALFLCLAASLQAADDYKLGPDSQRQPGVPQGMVTQHSWNQSRIFPGTHRDYWVYVPAQYKPDEPACVIVVQDGGGRVRDKGAWRMPIVFDNLIHRKEMPVSIGIFVNPGVVPAANENAQPRFNRSFEYDGMGDHYARFLLEEIIPAVARDHNLKTDGNSRMLIGSSSGGIAAFTAAWERPQEFSRVYCSVGTFVSLRGGNNYPWMIRKFEPKPIRVFLQDGSNDNNLYCGSWWVANQDMLASFQFAGYDVNHAWGDGGHNARHGASILPDALRWLWRDYPKPIAKPVARGDRALDVYLEGEDWELVSKGYKFTEGPAIDDEGNLFFTDIPNNRIHKVGKDGKAVEFARNTGGANGLHFGPDGRLYACANRKREIVAYDREGKAETVAEKVSSNDLVVTHEGHIYFTDPANKRVWFLEKDAKASRKGRVKFREPKVVDRGIEKPNGVMLSPDQTLLSVSDTEGRFGYSFAIRKDGTLAEKQKYHILHVPIDAPNSGADGMAMDDQGRLYVTTRFGIQVCDQLGRVHGVIAKPQDAWLSNVAFGGPDRNILYATCGDAVFKRRLNARGVIACKAPVKPPKPRL